MKTRKLAMLAAAVAVGGSAALIGAPAQATALTAGCDLGSLQLRVRATYTAHEVYNHWHNAYYEVDGGTGLGNQSNVHIRLRSGAYQTSDPTHWSYNSPDSVSKRVEYSAWINTITTMTGTTYLKFHGIFDLPLEADPSCVAYTDQI